MFTLTINSRQLILDEDFSPTMVYVNACWKFDEIPGPLALDITIPENDVNNNILNFPGRFSKMAKSNDRKYSAVTLRKNGSLWIHGTMTLGKPSNGTYQGTIQSQQRTLSDAQLEKYISDHELGGELTFQNKLNYDPDVDLYCTIRLHNSGFFVDKGGTEDFTNSDGEKTTREILTRKFDNTTGFMVNYTTVDGVKTSSNIQQAIVVSPFPFLHRIITELLKENKFFIRNNFIKSDSELKTLCLYNNVSICTPESYDFITSYTYYLKYHNNPDYVPMTFSQFTSQLWTTDKLRLKKLLPKMKLNELLLSVQNETNSFFHFSGENDVDNIDREDLFDLPVFDLSNYRVSKWLPVERQNLILNFKFNHDSDDQEFSENFVDLSSREDDRQPSVDQYADLAIIENPAIGEIRLVKSEKMDYEYRQESVDDIDGTQKEVLMWAPLSLDIQNYKYNRNGDSSEDIETKFSTLRMHENGFPIAYQKGFNKQFAQFTENFSPRLMFYNGNNTGGATATNGLSLEWKSLIANRWRRTAAFYANALIAEADFRFPGNIFYKVMNEIYKPFGDKDGSFFIKEMQAQGDNSEYVDVTLTVFKNEDNVFDNSTGIVDGGGQHVGATFTPKFIGVSESGWPILVTASGLYRSIPVFGDISTLAFAAQTCVDYSASDKLLFVGGNNGQLHVADLSDMDNIRYKTIQIYSGTEEICGVSLVDNGTTKLVMIGKGTNQVSHAYAQPYHASFDDYVSSEATATASFDHGTGYVRSFLFFNGYYYAATSEGEVFRTNNLATVWSQLADIDGYSGYNASMIQIAQTANRIWAAEEHDDSLYALKSNPTAYSRFSGLTGNKRQAVRQIQPTLGDKLLWMCADDGECIWMVDPGVTNANITPSGIKNAGGACFDGTKFAYIGVRDISGYTKIATFNCDIHTPEAMWSYLNVSAFFTKLFLY